MMSYKQNGELLFITQFILNDKSNSSTALERFVYTVSPQPRDWWNLRATHRNFAFNIFKYSTQFLLSGEQM